MVEIELKKLIFWLILRFFLRMLPYTLWVMPQDFAKWEAFVRYIFVVSFISLAFAAVQLWFSIHEMVPFWRFWALLPQIMFDLAEILTKGKVPTRQTLFEKSFEILNIGSNGIHPKFTVFVHFGAPFTAGKPKILLET